MRVIDSSYCIGSFLTTSDLSSLVTHHFGPNLFRRSLPILCRQSAPVLIPTSRPYSFRQSISRRTATPADSSLHVRSQLINSRPTRQLQTYPRPPVTIPTNQSLPRLGTAIHTCTDNPIRLFPRLTSSDLPI